MIISILFILFFILLATSLPISATLMGVSLFATNVMNTMKPDLFASSLVTALDTFPLLAVALFVISGDLMSKGGIAQQLFDVAHVLVGKFTGGHAIATVLTCMMFGAISGSGPATVAAIGAIMIPMMSKIGYDKTFSTSLVAVSGGLGVIIPPSIPMIMFGVVTGASVSKLFIAGILPGIICGICLMIYAYLYCKIVKPVIEWNDAGKERGLLKVLKDSIWSLFSPVLILGGIYGGIFTPTEAAGVSVFYAIIVSIFVTKQIKFKELPSMFINSAIALSPLMIVVASATVFGKVLTFEKAPAIIANSLAGFVDNVFMMLFMINIILLIVGALMDTIAAIIILAPILLPLVTPFGVDPIHFGIIMVVNLAIGFITPPIGMNIYVSSGLSGIPVMKIAKSAVPAMIALTIALFIITYFEWFSLVLIN